MESEGDGSRCSRRPRPLLRGRHSVSSYSLPLVCSQERRLFAARESDSHRVRDGEAEDGWFASARSRRPSAFTHLAQWPASVSHASSPGCSSLPDPPARDLCGGHRSKRPGSWSRGHLPAIPHARKTVPIIVALTVRQVVLNSFASSVGELLNWAFSPGPAENDGEATHVFVPRWKQRFCITST